MRALLPVLALLGGCDVWISDSDFRAFEEARCSLAFAAQDGDGDGFLGEDAVVPDHCAMSLEELLAAEALTLGDCDDENAGAFPGAPDACEDGVDADCDGVDPSDQVWYSDLDEDGYGDPGSATELCEEPTGSVQNGDDCDDSDPVVNPEGVETACADGVDGDCDGVTDCAIAGDVSLARSGWTAYGAQVTASAELEGGTFAVGEDLNGDGVKDAALGVPDAVLAFTWSGDAVDTDAISTGADTLSHGALALLPDPIHSGGIAVAWGAPGDGSSGEGAVVVRSLEGGEVRLTGSDDEDGLGSWVGDGADGLAIAAHTTYPLGQWSAILLDDNAVPDADAALSDLETERLTVGAGTSAALIGLFMAPHDGEDDLIGSVLGSAGDPVSLSWFEGPLSADTEARLTITHADRSVSFGAAAALMDLDGSGEVDLVVGAPEEGRVYVFLDAPRGALSSDDADYKIDGIADHGSALADVGDIDGDGIADLAIGVSEDDHVDLILGGTDPLYQTYATLTGAAGSGLGAAVAGEDMDGDGFSDLLLSAPGDGAIFLLWGGPPRQPSP